MNAGCLKFAFSALATVLGLYLIRVTFGASSANWFAAGIFCTGAVAMIAAIAKEVSSRNG
jgi:hypothetical protein